MLHDRIKSGFDLELLVGAPCFLALVRAGLAAVLGSDHAIDLAVHGDVAADARWMHVLPTSVTLHGDEPRGDLTVTLRVGLGPSVSEAMTGTRVGTLTSPPTLQRPSVPAGPPASAKKAPPAVAPSQPGLGRPVPAPVKQGPAPRDPAPPVGPSAPPLASTSLSLVIHLHAEGDTLRVEPGTMPRELATFSGWLSGHVGAMVALAALGVIDRGLRAMRFTVPGLARLPRIVWRWLAGDAQAAPALALLANLDLDLRTRHDEQRPPAGARGTPTAARSHLPPGVGFRLAAAATTFARLQQTAFWAAPGRFGEGDLGVAYLQKLELFLRPAQRGYVDIRIQLEIETPGLNGHVAFQVPVTPRVEAGTIRWEVGPVAHETDVHADLWMGVGNLLIGVGNLFGAGQPWMGQLVDRGGQQLGAALAQALHPLAGALPARFEVGLDGAKLTLALRAETVTVDAGGASFHLSLQA